MNIDFIKTATFNFMAKTPNVHCKPKHHSHHKTVSPNDFELVNPATMSSTSFYKYKKSTRIRHFRLNGINLSKGMSTHPYSGNVGLRGSYKHPIGTSGVCSCAVIFMYNLRNKIHSLYHSLPFRSVDSTINSLNTLMPEGFDEAIIVPGAQFCTRNTASTLYAAAKSINKDASIRFKHSESYIEDLNKNNIEFISYCGHVYQRRFNAGIPLFKEGAHISD